MTPAPADRPPSFSFAQRVLVATLVVGAVGAVAFFALRILDVLVLFFAACLVAILLSSAVDAVERRARAPRGVVLLGVLAVFAFVCWLGGLWVAPRLGEQAVELQRTLPDALRAAYARLADSRIGAWLLSEFGLRDLASYGATDLMGRLQGAFSMTLGFVGSAALVLIAGLYLAWDPRTYARGFLHLLPKGTRPRAEEVMAEVHRVLRAWLLARFAAMIAVGLMTSIGLIILDVPLAVFLGVLAGASSFVPIVGFFLAGILIVFFSLSQGTDTTLWVIALYLAVQWIEGHFITPVVEYRAVRIPPAMNLVAQLVMALMLGALGVLFASPLVATAFVMVRMLYVEDILGDPALAEHERERQARRVPIATTVRRLFARLRTAA